MADHDRTGLKVVAGIFASFGVLTASAAVPAFSAPTALLIDLFFFPIDGAPGFAGDHGGRLLAAVGGGMMVGWGVTLWRLAGDADIARAIWTGALAWFFVDTAASLLAEAWMRAPSNLSLLLAFYLALRPGLRRATGT